MDGGLEEDKALKEELVQKGRLIKLKKDAKNTDRKSIVSTLFYMNLNNIFNETL